MFGIKVKKAINNKYKYVKNNGGIYGKQGKIG